MSIDTVLHVQDSPRFKSYRKAVREVRVNFDTSTEAVSRISNLEGLKSSPLLPRLRCLTVVAEYHHDPGTVEVDWEAIVTESVETVHVFVCDDFTEHYGHQIQHLREVMQVQVPRLRELIWPTFQFLSDFPQPFTLLRKVTTFTESPPSEVTHGDWEFLSSLRHLQFVDFGENVLPSRLNTVIPFGTLRSLTIRCRLRDFCVSTPALEQLRLRVLIESTRKNGDTPNLWYVLSDMTKLEDVALEFEDLDWLAWLEEDCCVELGASAIITFAERHPQFKSLNIGNNGSILVVHELTDALVEKLVQHWPELEYFYIESERDDIAEQVNQIGRITVSANTVRSVSRNCRKLQRYCHWRPIDLSEHEAEPYCLFPNLRQRPWSMKWTSDERHFTRKLLKRLEALLYVHFPNMEYKDKDWNSYLVTIDLCRKGIVLECSEWRPDAEGKAFEVRVYDVRESGVRKPMAVHTIRRSMEIDSVRED